MGGIFGEGEWGRGAKDMLVPSKIIGSLSPAPLFLRLCVCVRVCMRVHMRVCVIVPP